jgi:hypothetical protein
VLPVAHVNACSPRKPPYDVARLVTRGPSPIDCSCVHSPPERRHENDQLLGSRVLASFAVVMSSACADRGPGKRIQSHEQTRQQDGRIRKSIARGCWRMCREGLCVQWPTDEVDTKVTTRSVGWLKQRNLLPVLPSTAARGAAGCNRDHAALYVVEGELR